MKVIRHVAEAGREDCPRVVAIGSFEGVHIGHQRVLGRVSELAAAAGAEPAVLLWLPRSGRPFGVGTVPRLTSLRQRLELIAAAGVQLVVLERGARPGRGEHLVAGVLAGLLHARVLVAGRTTGRVSWEADRRMTAQLSIDIVPSVQVGGREVSARAIRVAVARGDLAAACAMLGRRYSLEGRVVHGHHRGVAMGAPTANLRLPGVQLPPDGVYAVQARVAGMSLPGVANIGYNPTFGNRERSVETHLLDFDRDVYGQRLEVAFVERLRGERKFPDMKSLREQISRDVAAARRRFADR